MSLKLVLAGGALVAAFSLPAFADNKVCDFSMGGATTASTTTPAATATNAAGLTQNKNEKTSAGAGVNNTGVGAANANNANAGNATSTNASVNGNENNGYAYNDNGHPRWTAEFNGAGAELGSIEASIVKDCNTGDIMYLQLPAANASQTAARAAADLCDFNKQVWVDTNHEGGYLLCQFQGRRKLATAENK
jgi:hypothetical protein